MAGLYVYENGSMVPVQSLGRMTASGLDSGSLFASGAGSYVPEPDPDPDPPDVDYGRDLTSWMERPGGQTLYLPPGTYTMSNLNGHVKTSMLWLVAQVPGTVEVVSSANAANLEGIGFAGIHFARSLNIANGPGIDTKRLVFWYCEFTNDDAYHSATNATALTLFYNVRGAVYVMGCDVHNAQHDGIKANPSEAYGDGFVHIQGCRIWDLHGYTGYDYHCDAIQIEKGRVTMWDTVTGLDRSGNASPTGHIMTDNSQTTQEGTFLDMRRLWVSNSFNYGIHWDRKQTGIPFDVYARDIAMWGNTYSGVYTAGSPNIDQANVSNTVGSGTPPDVAWRNANPYESLATWASTAAGL